MMHLHDPDGFVCPTCSQPTTGDQETCPYCGTPLRSRSSALVVGTPLQNGRYRVGKVLGQGGFGITYKGVQTALKQVVAIKELFPDYAQRRGRTVLVAHEHMETHTQNIRNAQAEAQRMARVKTTDIVAVRAVFSENNSVYIVMEYLEGETLQQHIETRGTLPPAIVRYLARRLCAALETLHNHGLLHRDIKPENIVLTRDGRTVLVDFGAAREYQAGRTVRHTRILTENYGAPEQYSAQGRFGPATDLFALGATLYHALTGAPPPSALQRVSNQTLSLTLPADLGADLATTLTRALDLRVPARPQTAAEWRNLLICDPEKDILVELYQRCGGIHWHRQANWLSDHPLGEWECVTSNAGGAVTGLYLGHNRLTGPLPSALGNLSRLRELRLPGNQLTGTMPAALGNLAALQVLDLADNRLTGDLPPTLDNLTALRDLNLSGNPWTGLTITGSDGCPQGDADTLYPTQVRGRDLVAREKEWLWAERRRADRTIVNVRAVDSNRGGIIVSLGMLRGFIPTSQLSRKSHGFRDMATSPNGRFTPLVNRTLWALIIDMERSHRRLILSEKKAAQALLAELEVGETREGVVSHLTEFGAFVDMGGADGLIHISELSWSKVNHPSEVLTQGERVTVRIIAVNQQRQRITLSLRQLQPNPWDTLAERYQVGDRVWATITQIKDFGAFAHLAHEPVEGLIHISELSWERVADVADVVTIGEEYEVQIIRLDTKRRRLGLSIKQVQ